MITKLDDSCLNKRLFLKDKFYIGKINGYDNIKQEIYFYLKRKYIYKIHKIYEIYYFIPTNVYSLTYNQIGYIWK